MTPSRVRSLARASAEDLESEVLSRSYKKLEAEKLSKPFASESLLR